MAMSKLTEKNPLFGVRTGSIARGETVKFGNSAISSDITSFNDSMQFRFSRMSSNSAFLASGNQNQGSIAVSGKYGVSGVSSLEAGVSGYVGREKSDVEQHLTINLDAYRIAGAEYINFDELTLTDFLSGLTLRTRQGVLDVLDKYLAYINAAKGDDKDTATSVLLAAQYDFFSEHGDALVIATLVGAWGGVQMNVTSLTDEVMWKGGGTGKVAYAGTGASASLEAAFGHSELSNDQTAEGTVEAYSYGNAIAPVIEAWRKALETLVTGKLSALGKTTLGSLGDGPTVSLSDPPKFVAPKEEKSVAKKLGGIKSLDGLKALAQASAYDAYKKTALKNDEEPMTLLDFINGLDGPNNVDGIPDVDEDQNIGADNADGPDQPLLMRSSGPDDAPKKVAQDSDQSKQGFIAMGAWIVEWGQIIPWLVIAQDNSVPGDNKATGMVRMRRMQSDFEGLRRLYDRLRIEEVTVNKVRFNPVEISNVFLAAANQVNALLADHLTEIGGKFSKTEVAQKLTKIEEGLGTYKRIYEVWKENPDLRRAELGFGIVVDNLGSSNSYVPNAIEYNPGKDIGLDSKATGVLRTLSYTRNEFKPEAANPSYVLFADKIKGMPVILPNGEILLFVSNGQAESSGFLVQQEDRDCGCISSKARAAGTNSTTKTVRLGGKISDFTIHEEEHAIVFAAAKDQPLVAHTWEAGTKTVCRISLFPIPIDTVQPGLNWQGAAFSRGLGDLRAQINGLRDTLSGLPSWSLGSDYWEGASHNIAERAIGLQRLRPQYIGLVEERGGLFINR